MTSRWWWTNRRRGLCSNVVGDLVSLGHLTGGKPERYLGVYRLLNPCTRAELDPSWVGDIVAWVSGKRKGNGLQVSAEPNYLTVVSDTDLGASPWYIGGSPHGGSSEAKSADFAKQWAFTGTYGIDLIDPPESEKPAAPVYVFDTSPFLPSDATTPFSWLKVEAAPLGVSSDPACDIASHGLFVGGLINKVSPGSTVHLYQVLNACGQGRLSDLTQALAEFEMAFSKAGAKEEGLKAVVNLSLTVRWDPEAFDIKPEDQANYQLLGDLVKWAYDHGIVIVAAAGNDSYKNPSEHEPIKLPAAYSTVIGVAASDIQGNTSCYSNEGGKASWWVKAPGGDGERGSTGTKCDPKAEIEAACAADGANCPFGVISLVAPWLYPSGYAYWSGTSFATPLVSGLAARLVGVRGGSLTGSGAVDAVWASINCGADGAGGIAKVKASLSEPCVNATPTP